MDLPLAVIAQALAAEPERGAQIPRAERDRLAERIRAGESGDARCLVQAGAIRRELSRLEREAMQALSRLGSET